MTNTDLQNPDGTPRPDGLKVVYEFIAKKDFFIAPLGDNDLPDEAYASQAFNKGDVITKTPLPDDFFTWLESECNKTYTNKDFLILEMSDKYTLKIPDLFKKYVKGRVLSIDAPDIDKE